jgi:hypothetical protein
VSLLTGCSWVHTIEEITPLKVHNTRNPKLMLVSRASHYYLASRHGPQNSNKRCPGGGPAYSQNCGGNLSIITGPQPRPDSEVDGSLIWNDRPDDP